MSMSDKDKKTLKLGAVAVIVILLGGKVFSPMLSSWSSAGDTLESREAYMEKLALRAEAQDKLLTRKEVLSMRIGSLDVLQVQQPEEKKPEDPKEKKAEVPKGEKPDEGKEKMAETPKGEKPDEGKEKKLEAPKGEKAEVSKEKMAETPKGEKPDEGKEKKLEAPKGEKAEVSKEKMAETPKEENPEASKEKMAEASKEEKPEAPPKSPVPTIKASSLATYVEKNAKTAGIKIKRIAPQKNNSGRKNTKFFQPATIKFSFECKIKNLLTLLNDFENGEQFIRIDQIQINRDVQKGDALTVSMEVSSYEAQENS